MNERSKRCGSEQSPDQVLEEFGIQPTWIAQKFSMPQELGSWYARGISYSQERHPDVESSIQRAGRHLRDRNLWSIGRALALSGLRMKKHEETFFIGSQLCNVAETAGYVLSLDRALDSSTPPLAPPIREFLLALEAGGCNYSRRLISTGLLLMEDAISRAELELTKARDYHLRAFCYRADRNHGGGVYTSHMSAWSAYITSRLSRDTRSYLLHRSRFLYECASAVYCERGSAEELLYARELLREAFGYISELKQLEGIGRHAHLYFGIARLNLCIYSMLGRAGRARSWWKALADEFGEGLSPLVHSDVEVLSAMSRIGVDFVDPAATQPQSSLSRSTPEISLSQLGLVDPKVRGADSYGDEESYNPGYVAVPAIVGAD